MTSWLSFAWLTADGRTPHVAKHWLAQPLEVWHCGIAAQFGIELWQGQSAGLPAVISVVIVHDFAIATVATGAKAVTSASSRANMVRCKTIRFVS